MVARGDEMIAVPKVTNAGPELATGNPALASLTADERAELAWDDEANSTVAFRPALAVHVGQAVQCIDGRAGCVAKTLLDSSGQLRQVIVRLGRFWGRDVIVPVDWIGTASRMGVRLEVEQHRLQDLPDYRPDTEIAYEMPKEERHVVIPIAEVSFVTSTVVQVGISGIAAARHHDFAPGDFTHPDRAWRPPYPYAKDECLWTRP